MKILDNLPVKIRKLYKDIKAIENKRKSPFRISVIGKKGAGKSSLIKAFGIQRFSLFEKYDELQIINSDILIFVLPANENPDRPTLNFLKKESRKIDIIVLSKIDIAPEYENILNSLEATGIDFSNVFPVSSIKEGGIGDIRKRISDIAGVERIALAYQVPSFTSLAVEATAKATAKQNAIIATISIIPGADMPILTANQIKMIMEIGAAYGVSLNWERAKEILAVVATGYLLREAARQLLDFVPGPGWIAKGAVAYGGTIAIAKAADIYFSKVGDKTCKTCGGK